MVIHSTMASFEIRENSGSLFINADPLSDKSPTSSGRCKIDGRLYRISGWKKVAGNGLEFTSLSFQLDAHQASPVAKAAGKSATPKAPSFNDDLPF
jgi:hypothetical protein